MEHTETKGYALVVENCEVCGSALTDYGREANAIVRRCPNRHRPIVVTNILYPSNPGYDRR
jgi:hypothetical protein